MRLLDLAARLDGQNRRVVATHAPNEEPLFIKAAHYDEGVVWKCDAGQPLCILPESKLLFSHSNHI